MPEFASKRGYPTDWRAALPIFLMAPLLLSFPAQLLQDSIELTPEHSNELMKWSFVVGVLTTVTAFIMMIKIKPELRIRPLFGAVAFGALAGVGVGACFYPIADRIWRDSDFRGRPSGIVTQSHAIRRGYVTHGKGGYDHVVIDLFNADLHASPRDYHKFFHDADDIYPSGFCIRAAVQTNGNAARIFIPAIGSFPTGSISKC